MPRPCSVCTHPARADIDKALVGGEPCAAVAARYRTELGRMAVQRHRAEHVPELLSKAQDAQEVAQADDLLAQVRRLQATAQGILAKAEAAGDWKNALGAIRETRSCLELLGKLLGQLAEREREGGDAPSRLGVRVILADLRQLRAASELPEPGQVELTPAFWRTLGMDERVALPGAGGRDGRP